MLSFSNELHAIDSYLDNGKSVTRLDPSLRSYGSFGDKNRPIPQEPLTTVCMGRSAERFGLLLHLLSTRR